MSGQKVSLHPISGSNGAVQMAGQINAALGNIERAMNQRQTTQILYDTDHATARALLGKVPHDKNYLVAISKPGIDVIRALEATTINKNDFIFHSGIINKILEAIGKELDVIVEQAELMSETIQADIDTFEAIRAALDGFECANTDSGATEANRFDTGTIGSRIAGLRMKKVLWDNLVHELQQNDNERVSNM